MDKTSSDAVWWYLHELSSRVVAESGIATDRYHIGKLILRCLKDSPDFIMQINGATDERDTFKTAMERSIRCATAFRNLGLRSHDVIIIMAPNHLDLVIPLYAALYLGIAVAGVDMNLAVNELQDTIKFTEPKMIFCENSNAQIVQEAVNLLKVSPHIITFGKKLDHVSFTEFIEENSDETSFNNFSPADFDPKETNALLAATSGSTGVPKAAMLTHENIIIGFPCVMICATKFPSPFNVTMVVSPIQWVSATLQFILSPILKFTRVQSSLPLTPDHVYSLINTYKPEFTIMSPTFMTTLLKPGTRDICDFTCFKYLLIGGSAVTKELICEIKTVAPNAVTKNGYGLSEASGAVTNPAFARIGSLGVPYNTIQFKLIDPITNDVIQKPDVPGELYIKGPAIVKGYYNNAEMTAQTFENGWFKTGDILYRDEYHQLYFVDRLKSLLKYRNHQVSPVEIESVIIKHPGVLDVAVTGIPDDECGDLPVAFVIPREDCNITRQEIEDLVKASLTDTKHLRGGVVFVKEFPITATSKVDRKKLKEMAANLKKI